MCNIDIGLGMRLKFINCPLMLINMNHINSDYISYIEVLPIGVGPNQSLFWSGTFELVELVSCMCATGADVISSANTPSSEIINNIDNLRSWCGTTDNSSTGIRIMLRNWCTHWYACTDSEEDLTLPVYVVSIN